jgi:hypothetical protein
MRLKPSANASFRFFFGLCLIAVGAIDLAIIVLKSVYYTWPSTERAVAILCQIPLVPTVWDLVPYTYLIKPEDVWSMLAKPQGGLGLFLALYGLWNVTHADREFMLIGKASETRRMRELVGPDAPTSVSATIHAGGDVSWTGVNVGTNNSPQPKAKPVWKRPEGLIVGSVIAIVVGAWITRSMGLTP